MLTSWPRRLAACGDQHTIRFSAPAQTPRRSGRAGDLTGGLLRALKPAQAVLQEAVQRESPYIWYLHGVSLLRQEVLDCVGSEADDEHGYQSWQEIELQ